MADFNMLWLFGLEKNLEKYCVGKVTFLHTILYYFSNIQTAMKSHTLNVS